jgi:hypothetical protein
VNEIGERLGTSRSLVKVSALSPESIGGDHRLGLKAVSAYWTTQFDLTQRRHGTLSQLRILQEEIFVPHIISIERSSSLLLEISCQRIFSHPSSVLRSTP